MAEERKRRASSHGSVDLISSLPQDIINLILVHLPIKEAVRTSILSPEWRYKWCSIPHLLFDVEDFPYVSNADEAASSKIITIVDKVLLHHVGPIHKFSFLLESLVSDTTFLHQMDRIDRWIDLLSTNGIKSLVLSFFSDRLCYEVPSSLFDSQDLYHLDLISCTLRIPMTFKGLNKLTTLEITSCELEVPPACQSFPNITDLNLVNTLTIDEEDGGYGGIARLISKCPLLERLTIDIDGCGPLEINAPNLRYLCLNGSYKDLSFGRCPLLADVLLHCSIHASNNNLMEGDHCNLVKVLGSLHGIRRLEISDLKFFRVGNVPKMLSTPYYHLKCLSMQIDFKDFKEIFAALCIFRSSPNLQKLKIKSLFSPSYDEERVFRWFGELDCSFDHLQFIDILRIGGKGSELEFIRFLLAKTPLLDTMRIQVNIRSSMVFFLTQFQRASSRAKIIYL